MTIIDKIKSPAPILEYKPKPKFTTAIERTRYWAKQKNLWLNGVHDIPGTLYHKTQEQQIKDRSMGHIFRPICRDVDLLIHQNIAECRKLGEALVIIKGRGVGLSVEMGCLSNYFMKVFPGTTVLLTSQAQPKISSLFSEKVAVTYDNYDEDIQPVEINRNETKASCFLRTEQIYIDHNGKEKKNTSQIICRETSESITSASAFSGQGAILGCYDELFLHKRRKELVRSSASCYMNAKTRQVTGFLLAGGTVEDVLNNKDLSELKKMIDEIMKSGRLETMKARVLFIPAWMGTFMTNGWSDEKKGRQWWEQEIEQLEKLGDTSAVRAFRMNNPMSLKDIFEMTGGSRWEDDVKEQIRLQNIKIHEQENQEKKGILVNIGSSISFVDNKNGNISVLEPPRPHVSYSLNVDGVATSKKTGDDKGSNVAGTIVKMWDNNGLVFAPVCIYEERPKTIEQSYITLINQVLYYNQFDGFSGISAEANAGTADHFSTFIEKSGLARFILKRKDLSGKGYVSTDKNFQYVNTPVREFQMRSANMFLRKYIQNIRMRQLLYDMMKGETENADVLDSWLMWFTNIPPDFDKPIVKKSQKPIQQRILATDEFGRTYWKWIDLM